MSPHISHKLTPSFWGPYITSFKLFFSQPLLFLGMALVYAVFSSLYITFINLVDKTSVIALVELIASGIIGLLFYLVFVVVALQIVNGKKVDIKKDVKYPFTRFKELITLVVRYIWYVIKYPLPLIIFALVAFALVRTFGTSITNLLLLNIFSLVIAILGFIAIIWVIIRALRTVFIYYVFVAEKADSKVALEHGVDLMKGNWWRMFFFFLGFVFFNVLILFVIFGFLTILIPSASVIAYIGTFFQAVVILIMTLFLAQLYYSFMEYKK